MVHPLFSLSALFRRLLPIVTSFRLCCPWRHFPLFLRPDYFAATGLTDSKSIVIATSSPAIALPLFTPNFLAVHLGPAASTRFLRSQNAVSGRLRMLFSEQTPMSNDREYPTILEVL